MVFTSPVFIVFFIVVLLVTLINQKFSHEKNEKTKQIFLLIASYFFYGWWDWRFCFLLLFVTGASYLTALYSKNKFAYFTGVIVPLIVLGIFKYYNFFLESLGITSTLKIILPVGISFYTFQALSYVIDVHREKISVEKDFIKLALYISFFPQLVAGPIVRAADFLPQLHENTRKITAENFLIGIQIIAIGFFKKTVLADHLSIFVDDVFRVPVAFHWATIIFAVVSYAMQIYFDFSGYSDIAIGCAKCLGYDFSVNFNLPYISQNVTEFWRRWHISLSSWLRDYLYIPLGGNRLGKKRQLINLMITMLLGGLWHGAKWTFVFWGGLNGLALCLEKFSFKNKINLLKPLKILLTFAFISFTWIFFRAENFSDAWIIIKRIFTLQNGITQPFMWTFVALFIMIISEFAALIKAKKSNSEVKGFYPIFDLSTITGMTIFFTFVGLILGLAFTGENPFVYFQF